MQLYQARRKLANYQVEIRRNFKSHFFKQIRQEIQTPQLPNQAFTKFIANAQPEVPAVCIQHFKSLDLDVLNLLLQPMLKKQLAYQPNNQNLWVIDCSSPANLKFMSKLSTLSCPNLLSDFFRATVAVSRSNASKFGDLVQNNQMGCVFNLVTNQNTGELQIAKIYDKQSSDKSQQLINLLQFWASYIDDTQDHIQNEDLMQMMCSFKIYAEFKDLFYQRQSFIFIYTILKRIYDLKIMQDYDRKNSYRKQMAEDYYSFLLFVKLKLPFAIRRAVQTKTPYYQIAQILVKIHLITTKMPNPPNLFYQCLFQCEQLHKFVLLLLRNQQDGSEGVVSKKTALSLINYVTKYNMFELFYLEGAISITKELTHKILYDSREQRNCAIILWNIIERDTNQYLMKIIEQVDYSQLLGQIEEGNEKDVVDLVIKIVQSYYLNGLICRKIFEEAEFVKVLKIHMQKSGSETQILDLAGIMESDLDYFFQHFPKVFVQMYSILKQLDFSDREALLAKFEERSNLACQDASL